jgi:DNA processing protein
LKDEHLAVLLSLADSYRSDVYLLNARLAKMGLTDVEALLDNALAMLKRGGGNVPAGSDLRVMLSELTLARIAKRVDLVQEYLHTNVRIHALWDADYPNLLREIENPPLVLMAQGKVFPGARRVAIVGTREAGLSGLEDAREFASALAKRGHTIVSGLARGIDTFAHRGALDAGGTTLAVLAGHLGHVYPPENAKLFGEVMEAGSIVSEVTPFSTVHKGRWVERNRITSGISEAVVIPEFHGGGGTFHQAKFAFAQGRPVFVVNRESPSNTKAKVGVSVLTEMGASVVSSPEEVESTLALRAPLRRGDRTRRVVQSSLPATEDAQ